MIPDSAALIAEITNRVRSLSSYLAQEDYDQAVSDMQDETGWVFPMVIADICFWAKERVHRHLLFYLTTESARKFQIKSINLNQRFDHYIKLVEFMDQRWYKFLEENADLISGAETYELFGHQAESTWNADYVGRRIINTTGADFWPKKDM